ncbi:hypothetical protein MSG28_009618 [Choristoneura fumiferana]|uniref:Uncharacterized protein n=1 Tax=Choristoneura fumiferana TaxID=7141 RepID=A0ACC0JBV8_CHOFU|nr:hypothetical protein MSG28_009618 [Choristoneura fumiferana]
MAVSCQNKKSIWLRGIRDSSHELSGHVVRCEGDYSRPARRAMRFQYHIAQFTARAFPSRATKPHFTIPSRWYCICSHDNRCALYGRDRFT